MAVSLFSWVERKSTGGASQIRSDQQHVSYDDWLRFLEKRRSDSKKLTTTFVTERWLDLTWMSMFSVERASESSIQFNWNQLYCVSLCVTLSSKQLKGVLRDALDVWLWFWLWWWWFFKDFFCAEQFVLLMLIIMLMLLLLIVSCDDDNNALDNWYTQTGPRLPNGWWKIEINWTSGCVIYTLVCVCWLKRVVMRQWETGFLWLLFPLSWWCLDYY